MARRTAWEDTTIDIDCVQQNTQQLMTSFEADERMGLTCARWIGEFGIFSQTTAGAFGLQRVSLGIAMLDADAAAAGAFPDPQSSTDNPPGGWVYRTHCVVFQNGVGTNPITRCQFDLRGMRKFGSAVAYMIVENEAIQGASFNVTVIGMLRVLLLLS